MAFDTGAVANYLLDLAEAEGKPLTPMKLQKLLYFAHGWHLAITGGEALLDEPVEAWQWGPVVSSVYHEFKKFGAGPITGARFCDLRTIAGPAGVQVKLVPRSIDDCTTGNRQLAKAVLARVWEVYKNYSAAQLSGMTHQAKSPWHETWEAMGGKKKGVDIADDRIMKHFQPRIQSGAGRAG